MTSQTTFTACMHDQMLESNRDDVKLEAMRCVTVMTAKGKSSKPRLLFPHIVKNVSTKNPELKKLIYLYLTNFADQEPELALLPVATLQKSLKSPNPLVRSSALKVLTSMRLNILSAILMATLRNSVNDLSPYVRKTVAHSIIKIYRLDAALKEDLIEYIERLLNDKNSMVLSSAICTFEIVCPERLDLVLQHFRRYCFILADCNEWGQTIMLNLLARCVLSTCKIMKSGIIGSADCDPKILLRSAKPLIHSHNAAVVMAVIKLYISMANHNEVRSTIIRPLIRLLHAQQEIQLIVLQMVEEITMLSNAISELATKESDSEDEEKIEQTEQRLDGVTDKSAKALSAIGSNLAADPLASTGSPVPNLELQESVSGVEQQVTTRNGYIALDEEADDQNLTGLSYNGNQDAGDKLEEKEEEDSTSVPSEDKTSARGEKAQEGEEETSDEEEEGSEEESDEEEETSEEEDDSESGSDSSEQDRSLSPGADNGKGDTETNADNELNLIDLSLNRDPNAYREMFRPYIKSFFVKHTDSTQIRLAKLRILTNLSSPVNVSLILRELQAYISTYVEDREFVSGAIHAMGKCAIIVEEVAHICLNGLTNLLSNNNEHIVSEAIVVLRSQIINKKSNKSLDDQKQGGEKPSEDANAAAAEDSGADDEPQSLDDNRMVSAVIKQVTKLLPTVTAAQARATILWILAEFCDKNLTAAKCTPNVLRSIAKSFCQEEAFVKLQSLTLVSKFLLSLDKQKKNELYQKVQFLANYLFSLAKYDMNHDVRDRGRFLKKLLENEKVCKTVLYGGTEKSQTDVEEIEAC